MNRQRAVGGVLMLMLTLIASPGALAEGPGTAPTGLEVLQRYVEVTGGRPAYEKLSTRYSRGTLSIPAANLAGAIETWQAAPNSIRIVIDLEGAGRTEQGADGQVAWEHSAMTGSRILKDAEKAAFMRAAAFNAELQPEKFYKSIENTGTVDAGGKPGYQLRLISNEGDVETRVYDQESGLLVRVEATARTQMGDIETVSRLSDYRDFDGIKMPLKAEITQFGTEMVLTTDSIEHNQPIPADRFAPPAAVKALLTPATQPATR